MKKITTSMIAFGGVSSILFTLVFFFATYAILGIAAFIYCIDALFGKNIPWYADAIGGIALGKLAIPAAIILWILHLVEVISFPVFH